MKIIYYKPNNEVVLLDNVKLSLNEREIQDLRWALKKLTFDPNPIQCDGFVINPGNHYHVNDEDYSHEITVTLEEND